MFQTKAAAQLPLSSRSPDTHQFWSTFSLIHPRHFFFASIEDLVPKRTWRSAHFFFELTQLGDWAEQGYVHQVELKIITPPKMNRTNDWLWEPLAEAWECMHKNHPGEACRIFVTASGSEYCEAKFPCLPQELQKIRKVFPIE